MKLEAFERDFNVRRCERCCGNCRYFCREWEDHACAHPRLREYPDYPGEFDDDYNNRLSAYNGDYNVDEGFVCDLWEKETEGGAE